MCAVFSQYDADAADRITGNDPDQRVERLLA
jgi:hypothetical protein